MTSIDLDALRTSFETGQLADAAARLDALDTRDVVDADVHARVAYIAEQVGDLDRAIYEYNLCLRDDADHPVALRRLGRLRLDQGDDLRARRAWERLTVLEPTDAETQHALALLDARAGRLPKPRPGAEVAPLTDTLAPPGLGERRPARSPEPGDWPQVDDDAALTFVARFCGREGVHARQWSGNDGRHGYSPINEPFSPAVARQHLLGQHTVGVYPMRQNQTVRFLAFDFDAAKGTRDEVARGTRAWEAALRLVHAAAVRLLDAAAAEGMTGLLEDSGWKGRHVWFFFSGNVPAAAARQLADRLLARLPALPPEVGVEVFPKQSQLRPDQVGNLIKLPLGIHRVTGRRSLFLERDGTALADPIEALRTVPLIDRERVAGLLAQMPAGEPVAGRGRPRFDREARVDADDELSPPWETRADGSGHRAPALLPQRVEAPAYRLDDDVEVQTLFARCAVLRDIVDRARTQGVLTAEERSVVTYTLGHVTHGASAVNAILDHVPGHDPNERLKSPLRGHPTSCPKIRGRVAAVAERVGCACTFAAGAAAYPNPLIHVQEARSRGVGAGVTQSVELSLLQAERLVEDLRRMRADLHRLNRLAREAEGRIRGFMEDQALAAFETPSGVVHLDREKGTLRLELAGETAL